MKYTYILAIVLVVAVIANAANPDKKAAKKAAKEAKKKCKPVSLSYSTCTANKMTITKNPPAGVTGCTPITATIECVKTQNKTRGTCTRTKKIDYSACGTPGGNLETLMKTITISYQGCTKSIPPKTKQFPCSGFKGSKQGGAKKDGKEKKRNGGKAKKERKLRKDSATTV